MLPDEYASLARWFPTTRSRAAAIGVTREMIRRWEIALERGDRAPVRTGTARAITRLAEVAGEVERLVGDAAGAGRWLLVPQPALRGASVAAALRGPSSASIAPLIAPPATNPPARFSQAEVLTATAGLGPAPRPSRERPRDSTEAAILRRLDAAQAVIDAP
jgi:hypothetical protein